MFPRQTKDKGDLLKPLRSANELHGPNHLSNCFQGKSCRMDLPAKERPAWKSADASQVPGEQLRTAGKEGRKGHYDHLVVETLRKPKPIKLANKYVYEHPLLHECCT
uniref:Uncharacterized protein n=1 Tax=Trichuris muris TaxID=70415 RepID=A0A5S6R325_TRIMR